MPIRTRPLARRLLRVCTLLSLGIAAQAVAADGASALLVHIDKQEQRRLGIRTQRADAPPAAQWWPARVVADPQGSARVMPDQAGVLDAPPGGFPLPGSSVRAGELLARLRPSLSDPERRDLEAEWEASKRAVALGRLQIQRYSIDEAENLEVRLMTPSIQILLDYRAALAREAQLARALAGEVELRAPVGGTVLASSARAGRVVAAGEPLFEIGGDGGAALSAHIDPARFDVAAVKVGLDRRLRPVAVQLGGIGFDPLTRRARLLYRPTGETALQPLAVGDTVQLQVPPQLTPGRRYLPQAAVFRMQGRDFVWVHRGPEQFLAQAVHVVQRNDDTVQIEAGLAGDQRVVLDAAPLRARRQRPT